MPEPFGEPERGFVTPTSAGFATPTATVEDVGGREDVEDVGGQEDGRLELAVKDIDVTRHGKFSRVLAVDYECGRVLFPDTNDPPKSGSPSLRLFNKPSLLKKAVRATYRLQVIHDNQDIFCGSGFAISPRLMWTCDHVVPPSSWARCMGGDLVRNEYFWFPEKARYHLQVMHRDHKADCALAKISHDVGSNRVTPNKPKLMRRFPYFLLPCSSAARTVCVMSFPDITCFMKRAHRELIDGVIEGHSVWNAYKNAMREELKETRYYYPLKPEADIESRVKRILYAKLVETFSGHCTGVQAASLGALRKKGNEWTTTCSTLHGSSGGPVCHIDTYGYFCGWHKGASQDNLGNEASSCDDPVFVRVYFEYILEDLPNPNDEIWLDWDLSPFFRWLLLHECSQTIRSDRARRWIDAARERCAHSSKRLKS